MQITNLLIKNFLTIGEIQCDLSSKGLVLIQGQNEDDTSQDSNGSGKSSFPDALSWCGYGVTARGVTGNDVVNDTEGKNCSVEMCLEDDDSVYRIARYRKHKDFGDALTVEVLDDSAEWKSITKGTTKLTQSLVTSIIGCSEDVFNAAIYAGQDNMPDLPGMSDKFLKLLVEEAAGIDRLQRAHVIAKMRGKEVDVDIASIDTLASGMQARVKDSQDELDIARANKRTWNNNVKLDLAKIAGEIKHNKALLDDEKRDIALMDEKTLLDEMDEITKKLSASGEERNDEKKLSDEVTEAKLFHRKRYDIFGQYNSVIKNQEHTLKHLMDEVGKGCNECGKLYEAKDMSAAKKRQEKALKDSLDQQKAATIDLDEAEGKLSEARDALLKYQQSMTDISKEVTRQSEIQASLNEITEKRRELAKSTANLKAKVADYKKLGTMINPHLTEETRLGRKVKDLQEDILDVLREKGKLEEKAVLQDMAIKVFGPAGVRAHILDTVTPFLNKRTNHYLGTLTDGNITATWQTLTKTAKGDLREKFTIEVRSCVGAKSFKGLSGGEKRKARLACSMALQDLVASRATKPIQLYIADEIDHALDESGLERLMTILDEKAKDRGTVLTISHTDLKSWVRNSVTIKKEGGKSTMTGSAL